MLEPVMFTCCPDECKKAFHCRPPPNRSAPSTATSHSKKMRLAHRHIELFPYPWSSSMSPSQMEGELKSDE